jgi:hypothetical protein
MSFDQFHRLFERQRNSGLSRGLDHAGNRSSSRPRNRRQHPKEKHRDDAPRSKPLPRAL